MIQVCILMAWNKIPLGREGRRKWEVGAGGRMSQTAASPPRGDTIQQAQFCHSGVVETNMSFL